MVKWTAERIIKERMMMEQGPVGSQKQARPATTGPAMGVITEMNGVATDPNVFNPVRQQAKTVGTKKHKKNARRQMIIAMVISIVIAVGCGIASVIVALSARS